MGIEFLMMAMVGGSGYLLGAVVGAALITLLKDGIQDYLPLIAPSSRGTRASPTNTLLFCARAAACTEGASGRACHRLWHAAPNAANNTHEMTPNCTIRFTIPQPGKLQVPTVRLITQRQIRLELSTPAWLILIKNAHLARLVAGQDELHKGHAVSWSSLLRGLCVKFYPIVRSCRRLSRQMLVRRWIKPSGKPLTAQHI